MNDKIQNSKFVNSILRGGVNIFNEIKKFRGLSKQCSSRIDEEIGSQDIASHFANIYSELYNRADNNQDFQEHIFAPERGLNAHFPVEFSHSHLASAFAFLAPADGLGTVFLVFLVTVFFFVVVFPAKIFLTVFIVFGSFFSTTPVR